MLGNNNNCRTFILSDDPATNDDFSSHSRLTETIVEMIDSETNGKTIALTGQWGSGKSTVISLLRKKLENKENNDKEIRIIEFDAWEHEGNSLRRSFLESILDSLESIGWIKAEDWKNTRNKLSRKLKETETKSFPVITPEGKQVVLTSALSVLGVVGINKLTLPTVNSSNVETWQVIPHIPLYGYYFFFIMCVIFTVSPISVLLFHLIRNWKKKDKSNILTLFLNKTDTVVITETLESPEPTSIEFQEIFGQIMDSVLSNHNKRKIILVIDNLDRLSKEDILKTWSTMRTFFDSKRSQTSKWRARYWTILPFDKNALGNALSEGKSELVNSLMDKTIQVRLDVPPPALTRWKEYLFNLLSESLPDHDKKDFHSIYRIYLATENFTDEKQSEINPITPRSIKIFVNQIGAIHRIWGDTIPLNDQALYAMMQLKKIGIYKELLEKDSVFSKYAHLVSENYFENFASIYFNVDQEVALQVLLGPSIESAIVNCVEDISELSLKPGFYEILERLIEENKGVWEKNYAIILNLAVLIKDFKPTNNLTVNSLNSIKYILVNIATKVANWEIDSNENFGRCFTELLEIVNENERINGMLERIQGIVPIDIDKVDNWLEQINIVINYLDSHDLKQFIESIRFPVDEEKIIDLFWVIKNESNLNVLNNFINKINVEVVLKDLTTRISIGSFTYREQLGLSRLNSLGLKIINEDLINRIDTRLSDLVNNNSVDSLEEVQRLVNYIYELDGISKEINQFSTEIKNIFSSGSVFHHLYFAWSNQKYKHFGSLLFALFSFNPTFNQRNNIGESINANSTINSYINSIPSFREITEEIFNSFINHGNIQNIFDYLNNSENRGTIARAIVDLIFLSEDHKNKYITSDIIVANFEVLQDTFNNKAIDELKSILNHNEIIPLLIKQEFKYTRIPLYIEILKPSSSLDLLKDFYLWLADNLRKMNKEQWKNSFESLDENISLLSNLSKMGNGTFFMGITFTDALIEILQESVRTNKKIPIKDILPLLHPFIEKDHYESFARQIINLIIITEYSTVDFLDGLSSYVFSSKNKITRDLASQLIDEGFNKMIQRQEVKEIQLISKILKITPEIIKQCKKSTLKTFVDRVENYANEAIEEEIKELLSEIFSYISNFDLSETAVAQEE